MDCNALISGNSHDGRYATLPALDVDCGGADGLSAQELSLWSRIQQAHADYASPLFSPEFARVVASVRDDTEVAVLKLSGVVVGFFPFHRRSNDIGTALADRVSDLHGVVIDPALDWDPRALAHA